MFNKVFKEIKYLEEHSVEIGILAIDKNKINTKSDKKSKATILEYAIYNEFGTKNIPARPFMRTTIDKNYDLIKRIREEQFNRVIRGDITAKQALMILGETVRGMIIETILDAKSWAVKNSPKTIKIKSKRAGAFYDDPLQDSGFLVTHIRYQIISKKGKIEYLSPFKEV
ncbi:hypothetical protein [Fusobacterium gastrosuis]|uniref:hypothetical protein n=1 Tax=Fusobacterium gastrosuis TaxID=1755100 RepID=UPI002975D5C4|nr:hypothetical protein [Fusobacteriaceae bacterium]MDY5712359.1 hypothetical protein [Fusobacterium gastrosuis]